MINNGDSRRGLVRGLSLAAAAMLLLSAAFGERAEALSLINTAAAPAAKLASDGLTTEVRGHGGGGGGHGSGFRTAHVFHGGGFYRAHHGGFRFAHRHHHFHRRFFYGPSYYAYPYYYTHRYCRVIWTYYGPRRICHHRHWRYHHWRHHHRHHLYW